MKEKLPIFVTNRLILKYILTIYIILLSVFADAQVKYELGRTECFRWGGGVRKWIKTADGNLLGVGGLNGFSTSNIDAPNVNYQGGV